MPLVIDALNNFSAAWIPLVAAIVWQSTLLAILVAAVAGALRRSSPAVRYWLWQIVAIKLLAAPLWSITLAVPWPIPAGAVAPRAEHRDLALTEALADRSMSSERASAASVPRRPGTPVAISAVQRAGELSWRSWLLIGWGAAVGLQLAQLVVQRRRLSRLLRGTRPAGDELIATVRNVAQGLQLARPPRVLLTHDNCSPFVHGAIHASLILPQTLLATLSPAELRQVLLHELAHVKRRDLAWGWTTQIARTLYFFHPVAHWCYWRIRLERELACDQLAISVGGDKPGDYVQTLVRVVSHISQPPALQNAVAMLAVDAAWPGNRSTSSPTPAGHERAPAMKDTFGPWTTAIDTGSSAQLSTFWKRRLAMLPAVSYAPLIVSPGGRLLLAAAAAIALGLPTLHLSPTVARPPDGLTGNAAGQQTASTAPADEGAADGQPFRATLTGGSVVNLPGKAVVEMLGVGEHPSTGKEWWAPDGTPILAPYEKIKMRVQPANNEVMREIAMRVIEPPGTSVQTHLRFNSSSSDSRAFDANGKALKGVWVVAGGFLPQQATCTVGISVATGPWNTLTKTNGRGSGSMGMRPRIGLAFAPAYEQGKDTLITITYAGVDGELRVIAVDAAGKDIIGTGEAGGARDFTQTTTTFPHVALKDIVEFRVETRPYQNFEVRELSLRPGHLTTPKLVEIAPRSEAKDKE